jgi:hypothetical protein
MNRSIKCVGGALGLVFLVTILISCAGQIRPSTPPTFVLAYTNLNTVRTAESPDGVAWRNGMAHAGADTEHGPAIAHDGNLTWLLMWGNRGGLDFKVGTGGVPLSGGGGVIWEQRVNRGALPVQVVGSPAIAHGNNRWVVAFRTAGDRIFVVRSLANSATNWEAARQVEFASPSGPRPAITDRDPALAFGENRFVLLFRRPALGDVAAAPSADGLIWDLPVAIGPQVARAPTLTFQTGRFYAARSGTDGEVIIHKSTDGRTWFQIGHGGRFRDKLEDGLGLSFGICKMLVTHGESGTIRLWTGTPPQPPHSCSDPGLLTFAPAGAPGDLIQALGAQGRTAVAFGETRAP